MATPKLLKVLILAPKKTIFSGDVIAVSSKNSSGNFDILPEHANFITLVENQPITIRMPDNKRLTFNFPVSIIYNSSNIVKIYTDIII
jgi:F0F1-type ATP synthase epsilon subunit